MAGNDDNPSSRDPWESTDKKLRSLQAKSEKLMQDLRDDAQRFQREMDQNTGTANSPFSAFKKFVDRNVDKILAPSYLARRRQQQEELDISARWTGSSENDNKKELGDVAVEDREKAMAWTDGILDIAAMGMERVPLHKIVALYKDPEAGLGMLDHMAGSLLSLGGTWFYMPETGDTLPTASNWSLPSGMPSRWLSMGWFKRSQYSPVRLEAHPDARLAGKEWRAAFEDLLDSTLETPREFQYWRSSDSELRSMSGRTWVLNMQTRGVLPPLLPRFFSDSNARQSLDHTSIRDLVGECHRVPWSESKPSRRLDALSRDLAELRCEVATTIPDDTSDDLFGSKALPKYPTQLLPLEQQNKERLPMARQEQNAMAAHPVTTENGDHEDDEEVEDECYAGLQTLEEREMELREQSSKEHLFRFRREQDNGYDDEDDAEDDENDDQDDEDNDDDDRYLDEHHFEQVRSMSELTEQDQRQYGKYLLQLAKQTRNPEISDPGMEKFLRTMLSEFQTEEDELAQSLEQQEENLKAMVGEKSAEKAMPAPAAKACDVLSALTTTQTTRLPDGTVTTKVVLKKRFADGREETSESVHTTNERLVLEQARREEESEKPEKRSGWFWS